MPQCRPPRRGLRKRTRHPRQNPRSTLRPRRLGLPPQGHPRPSRRQSSHRSLLSPRQLGRLLHRIPRSGDCGTGERPRGRRLEQASKRRGNPSPSRRLRPHGHRPCTEHRPGPAQGGTNAAQPLGRRRGSERAHRSPRGLGRWLRDSARRERGNPRRLALPPAQAVPDPHTLH